MTTIRSVNLQCPGCGAPIRADAERCEYCGRPLTVTSFTSVDEMQSPLAGTSSSGGPVLGSALSALKLHQYERALPLFEQAMAHNPNNSEAAFYYAVCLLKGKKAFLASMPAVKKAIECLESAVRIDPRGIYYYFLAYIKQDFYARKHLRISPDYQEELMKAVKNHVTKTDIKILFDFLGVQIPAELQI